MTIMKLNEDGIVVDGEGEPIMHGDEQIEIPGMQSAEQVKQVVQARLARQAASIKELEKVAEQTPELKSMIEGLKTDLGKSKESLEAAETNAAKKIATQLDEANDRFSIAEKALAEEKVGRMRDQVTTQILSLGGDFINPAQDLAPILLAAHSREPVIDETGKPSGEVVDRFKLTFPDPENEGSAKTEKLPLDKAVEVVKALNIHYVKGNKGAGGSGGSQYTPGGRGITKMSQLKSREEKVAFVGAHGREAFEKLTAD